MQRTQDAASGAALAAALETSTLESDKLALELFNGRITRGDYNKRRRDLYTRANEELRKILAGGAATPAKPAEAAPGGPLVGI